MPWGRRAEVSMEEMAYMNFSCKFLGDGDQWVKREVLLLNAGTFMPEDPFPSCLEHGRMLFLSLKELQRRKPKGLGIAIICLAR